MTELDERIDEVRHFLYAHFEDCITKDASWIIDSIGDTGDWIWGTLQGSWNPNMTDGQIIADVIISSIPVFGWIFDGRDILFCVYDFWDEKSTTSQTEKWIFLSLSIAALVPGAGDVIKGGFKIIFNKIRKYGINQTERAIKEALSVVFEFLRNEKVVRVLGSKRIKTILNEIIQFIQDMRNALTVDIILKAWDDFIYSLKKWIPLFPSAISDLVMERVNMSNYLRHNSFYLENALKQADFTLEQTQNVIRKEIEQLDDAVAPIGQKTPFQFSKKADPSWTATKKGIYGELVSDEFMQHHSFENKLSPERQKRLLEEIPAGRGIDGVYKNTNPPPPYVITETKFRTKAGDYIDSDGTLTTRRSPEKLLGNTNDGRQMSKRWIENRLEDAVGAPKLAKEIRESEYERWLMIVDPDGQVAEIYQLNDEAKVIGTVKL